MKLAHLSLLAIFLAGPMLSGCGLVAAGTAGGVAATELSEDDDSFDPLENTDVGEEVYE